MVKNMDCDCINLYRKMITIRYFEERVSQLKYEGEIYGAVHCCIGQEAVPVGICSVLKKEDRIVGTHRSHGYMIAKGANINAMMSELFGKETGTNGGRGGSLHVCDPDIGALGATGIVGSGIPIACGSAFAAKYKHEDVVSVAFLGDGAANEGVFFECLNLASKWTLPMIFIVENNGFAVTTRNTVTTENVDIYKHAESFGMKGNIVDGQDVEGIFKLANVVIERVRKTGKPEILEAKTYRFHEHAEGKGYLRMQWVGYRDEKIKKEWMEKRDPISLYEKKLFEEYNYHFEDLELIKEEERNNIESAVLYARSCKEPDVHMAYEHVYVE